MRSVESVLSRPWSADQYRELLMALTGHTWLRHPDQLLAEPGIWLRHDLEVSAVAALQMANVEAELGISATYFICRESPYFLGRSAELGALEETLLSLGHSVGPHELPKLGGRLNRPRQSREPVTFHAPATPLATLAALDGGDVVYAPVADGRVTYRSDSTGRWRWGDPVELAGTPGLCLQLLVHPCWWFPSPDVTREIHFSASARAFLPNVERDVAEDPLGTK